MRPRVVAFGEALWDLLPEGRRLGGAPLNFVYRCAALGCDAQMISALGADKLGRLARKQIRSLGLDDSYIYSVPGAPTGTVEVYFDEARNPDYTIVPDVAYDRVPLTEEMVSLVAGAQAFCFGTLAQRDPRSRETLTRLIDSFSGDHLLLDINLRKACYTEESVRWSIERATILKLNEDEARYVAELYGIDARDLGDLGRELLDKGSLTHCVITLGPAGALVATDGEAVELPGHAVELADPLGAGDAFSAAFITALLEGRGPIEAGRLGNRLGAIVAGQDGATEPIPKEFLAEFLQNYGEVRE